jgi:hypothetical protein
MWFARSAQGDTNRGIRRRIARNCQLTSSGPDRGGVKRQRDAECLAGVERCRQVHRGQGEPAARHRYRIHCHGGCPGRRQGQRLCRRVVHHDGPKRDAAGIHAQLRCSCVELQRHAPRCTPGCCGQCYGLSSGDGRYARVEGCTR